MGVRLSHVRKLIVAATALALGEFPTPARADGVDDLVARGEELAKQGEWTQAIIAFKAADVQHPRAKHACLIGLAYTRRELWPQAEVFFGRCRARISADDPAPAWLPDAERTLAEKLATSNAAAVTIVVTPSTTLALVSVSAFAPDETFSPRTIHLAPGTYTITVTAPEHVPSTTTLVIDGTTHDVPVAIQLTPASSGARPAPSRVSRIPTSLIAAGSAVVVLGFAHHVVLTRPAHDALRDASTNADYEANLDRFTSRRRVTLALYGLGVVTAAAGVVLRYTVFRRTESPVQITAAPASGGAIVSIGWQR